MKTYDCPRCGLAIAGTPGTRVACPRCAHTFQLGQVLPPPGAPVWSAAPRIPRTAVAPGQSLAPSAAQVARAPTAPPATDGRAVASMVLGIIGLLVPFVGIIAIVLASKVRRQGQAMGRDAGGFALAGLILGWIGTAIATVVLITVVLAATVFVLVSDLGGGAAATAPAVNFTPDEEADRLVVSSAALKADWNRLQVRVRSCGASDAGLVPHVGGNAPPRHSTAAAAGAANRLAAPSTDTQCGAGVWVPLADGHSPIWAENFLAFGCSGGRVDSSITNVAVEIRDRFADQLVYAYTFVNWAPCALD